MDRARAQLVAGAAAMIAFAATFAYPAYAPMRVLWYYPVERRWAFEVEPIGLAMDFYGRTLAAAVVALVVAALVGALARRRAIGDRLVGLAAGWAITAVALAMAFYAWQLARRVPRGVGPPPPELGAPR
jgi:hypothetical protein